MLRRTQDFKKGVAGAYCPFFWSLCETGSLSPFSQPQPPYWTNFNIMKCECFGNNEAAMMTQPWLAKWLHIGSAMAANDDTANRKLQKKQPCIAFSQVKVHLYALFRHGWKYLCEKIPREGVECVEVLMQFLHCKQYRAAVIGRTENCQPLSGAATEVGHWDYAQHRPIST